MNYSDFIDFLKRFAERPIPATINRHVYLWLGEVDDLTTYSPQGLIKKLDLHMLCKSLSKTPLGDKAAGRVLSDAIEEWLSQNLRSQQQAIVVTGIDLLFRYQLPLSSLIRLANENTIVILALSDLDANFRPNRPLPSYIQFSPYAILKFAASEVPEEAIVKEE